MLPLLINTRKIQLFSSQSPVSSFVFEGGRGSAKGTKAEKGETDPPKQLEMSNNSELLGLGDLADEEPNDLSFELGRVGILANEEALSSEPNRFESEFQLQGAGLYEHDNETNLPLHNPYY